MGHHDNYDELLPPIKGHQKYMVSDLPFPGGKTHYWHKYFVPCLVAWAGSQDDPFGTNNGVRTEAVCIWGRVLLKRNKNVRSYL